MPLLLLEAEGGVLAASAAGVGASAAADSARADLVCGLPLPLPLLLPGGVLPLLELWLRLLMEAKEPHGSTAQHSTGHVGSGQSGNVCVVTQFTTAWLSSRAYTP